MNLWPLSFRELPDHSLIFSDDAGGYFKSTPAFLDRYVRRDLLDGDLHFLNSNGHCFACEGDLDHTAFACRWSRRQAPSGDLSYVILIPTLRCNLTCTYCQVSRAAETANGYDWTPEVLDQVLSFLDALETSSIKIEFQGGEPLLRLDLLDSVRDFCRRRFAEAEFVVCTNLQSVNEAAWGFLAAPDTRISTSFDGDAVTHTRQRTSNSLLTEAFLDNFRQAMSQLGPSRVSALPTLDPNDPPDLATLVNSYEALGLSSIYLRPINHQGFARRRPANNIEAWNRLQEAFVRFLIDRNYETGRVVEDYYFSLCLKRVLHAGEDGHVDLRNPNLFATSYIVVDHDGRLFPSDEARMLYRIGHVDLAIGHVASGIEHETVDAINSASLNNFDPDCIHCPYQPFCGSDIVDDISRYERSDLPRHETWFCRRHTAIFDLVFQLLYSPDHKVRFSVAHWAGLQTLPAELAPVHV